jgi:AraC-like DNA-binding protein
MKPRLEQLANKINAQSFICYEVQVAAFEFLWHYHPEYELTYIIEGKGKRLVGDSYEYFQAGDWVLLPPMLPHTWVSDKTEASHCRAIVIQFSPSFIQQLFQFTALQSVEKLFAKANRGLQFAVDGANENLLSLLQKMSTCEDLPRLTYLLQVLHLVSNTSFQYIASAQYKLIKGTENQHRINQVFQYMQKEFTRKLSLEKAAALIHLSESAFCKFFKRTSGKTFSDYTNDIRIAHACYLLIETDKPVNVIATESGFESLTYFNRIFLKKKNLKPSAYRRL